MSNFPFPMSPALMSEDSLRGLLAFLGIKDCRSIILSWGVAPLDEGDYIVYFDQEGKFHSEHIFDLLETYLERELPDYKKDYVKLQNTKEYKNWMGSSGILESEE